MNELFRSSGSRNVEDGDLKLWNTSYHVRQLLFLWLFFYMPRCVLGGGRSSPKTPPPPGSVTRGSIVRVNFKLQSFDENESRLLDLEPTPNDSIIYRNYIVLFHLSLPTCPWGFHALGRNSAANHGSVNTINEVVTGLHGTSPGPGKRHLWSSEIT